MPNYGILVHGGQEEGYMTSVESLMKEVTDTSCLMLKNGTSAVNVAEHATVMMENSGLLNAGTGSCLTREGVIEMDAGIMDGKTMRCGAVGSIKDIKNPIIAARKVMYESIHSLIAGDSASKFALKCGLSEFKMIPGKTQQQKFESMLAHEYGTVGAVVMDSGNNLAAEVSTGGMWLKTWAE